MKEKRQIHKHRGAGHRWLCRVGDGRGCLAATQQRRFARASGAEGDVSRAEPGVRFDSGDQRCLKGYLTLNFWMEEKHGCSNVSCVHC